MEEERKLSVFESWVYMAMSLDQNAGRSQNMEINNSSFERFEQFKYWEQHFRIL